MPIPLGFLLFLPHEALTMFLTLGFTTLLIVGLIKPKLIDESLTWKKSLVIFGGACLILAIFSPDEPTPVQQNRKEKQVAITDSVETSKVLHTTDSPKENLPVPTTTSTETEIKPSIQVSKNDIQKEVETSQKESSSYLVTKIVDGDTIDVNIDGKITRLRLIGMNTPETVDPRKPVECFGKEASAKAKELLLNKKVKLEADSSQDNIDKYGRLLRYVSREDGLFYNKWMIENGYAYEYTYNTPYKYQTAFKNAQKQAEQSKLGLWSDNACKTSQNAILEPKTTTDITNPPAPQTTEKTGCLIKGNISSNEEKIYHLPGCQSYNKTQIDESKGERWFCTETEAQNAGWRKAGNC